VKNVNDTAAAPSRTPVSKQTHPPVLGVASLYIRTATRAVAAPGAAAVELAHSRHTVFCKPLNALVIVGAHEVVNLASKGGAL
jgi:hypothetical protein